MASYTAYVYCDKCDRPLRKNEYRMEVLPSGRNISITYYCKLCGSNARGFDCVAGIPGSLMAIVGLLLVPPFLAFFYEPGAGMDMEILSFFYKCMPFPAFLFLLFHYWKKSKCKPIYDRWVMQHGLDPENWPDESRLYSSSENRKPTKWGNMSTQQRIVLLVLLFVFILVGALIWYNNYNLGLF